MEEFTKEKCEKVGMLINTPKNRKDKVVKAINLATEAIIENMAHTDDNQFDTLPIPVIIRIVSAVDVPDEDIPRLYNEIHREYKNHDFDQDKADCDYMKIDFEAMFLSKFAEFKINQYKNK